MIQPEDKRIDRVIATIVARISRLHHKAVELDELWRPLVITGITPHNVARLQSVTERHAAALEQYAAALQRTATRIRENAKSEPPAKDNLE